MRVYRGLKLGCWVMPVVLLLAVMLHPLGVRAKVYIDITSPGGKLVPVAILMKGDPDAKRVEEVVKKDLELYGLFKVLNPKVFITDTFTKDNFKDWRFIGAEILVVAHGGTTNGRFSLEARVYDVVEGKEILARKYSIRREAKDLVGMRLADDIFTAFTGEEGIFYGSVVLSVKTRPGVKELGIISPDGSSFQILTHDNSINLSPAWSPDGKWVAYTSFKRGEADLYLLEVATGIEKVLSKRKGAEISPSWSPDGTQLAFSYSLNGNSDIYIKDLITGYTKRITRNPAIDTSPAWSPDGRKIAFVSRRSGAPHIYVMNTDGSDQTRLTFGPYEVSPAWSPKGDKLAYVSVEGGKILIHVLDMKTGNSKVVVQGEDPCWSPNGRYIMFFKGEGGRRTLYLTTEDGNGIVKVRRLNGSDPCWRSLN